MIYGKVTFTEKSPGVFCKEGDKIFDAEWDKTQTKYGHYTNGDIDGQFVFSHLDSNILGCSGVTTIDKSGFDMLSLEYINSIPVAPELEA